MAEQTSASSSHLDHGRAWVVALAGFVVIFLGIGLYRSIGIIMKEVKDVYSVPTAEVTVIMSFLGIGLCFSAMLFIFGVGDILHERALIVASGLLLSIGFIVTYFSRTIQVIYVLGFCTGAAVQTGQACTSAMIGKYFEKRLSVANALAFSGVALSVLVMPAFIQWLIYEFTYRGTALILGGLVLNTVVSGALMKPVSLAQKKPDGEAVGIFMVSESGPSAGTKTAEDTREHQRADDAKTLPVCQLLGKSIRDFAIKESRDTSKKASILKTLSYTFRFFKNPSFVLFQLFIYFITLAGECLVQLYPSITKEVGLSDYQSAYLLSILGASGFLGRGYFGFIGDRYPHHRYKLIVVHLFILCAGCFLSLMATVLWSQIIFAATVGFNYGIVFSFRELLLLDFFGLPTLLRRIGVTHFVTGVGYITGGPLLGFIRDSTGDFKLPLQMIGIFFFLGGATLIVCGIYTHCQRRKSTSPENNVE